MARPSDPLNLNKFLAKEQNTLDHLTEKIYGPGFKFEKLSALGQYTIESLARQRAIISDPDPELRTAKAQVFDLQREIEILNERLSKVLRVNQDLTDENEQIKLELYERQEEDNLDSRPRRREERSPSFHQEQIEESSN